jgi:hypothetical protein
LDSLVELPLEGNVLVKRVSALPIFLQTLIFVSTDSVELDHGGFILRSLGLLRRDESIGHLGLRASSVGVDEGNNIGDSQVGGRVVGIEVGKDLFSLMSFLVQVELVMGHGFGVAALTPLLVPRIAQCFIAAQVFLVKG